MRKVYKDLTPEQRIRKVIFSSQLAPSTIVHEVYDDTENKDVIIARLLNDKFFNNSPFTRNIIRQ